MIFYGLGTLPGHNYSLAADISADGVVVVGSSGIVNTAVGEAFRWSAVEGMIGLGDLPGGEYRSIVGVGRSPIFSRGP